MTVQNFGHLCLGALYISCILYTNVHRTTSHAFVPLSVIRSSAAYVRPQYY